MPKKQSLSRSMSCIDRLIHSTLDVREIMPRVITEAARAVGSGTAAVSLRQGDHWIVRYVHGLPKEVIGAQMDGQQEPHVMLAIQTRKSVVINDAFTDERVNREHMKKWGVRSVLVVPLVTQDEVIGVLCFHQHRSGVPFTESHVEFADQLASSLAPPLRNTGLFERLQAELAERKKAEQALQQTNELLQVQTEELQTQAEELRTANEQLQAQQEELRAQTEELRAGAESLRESEQRYRSLFENMLDGYAYCRMLFDGQGRPTDFLYLDVNSAFARLTGLNDVVGKKATAVIPTIRESHPELLETYGRVATTGRPERFEMEFTPLGIWLSISVYSPRKSYFIAVFENITERKQAEHERRERMKELACLYAVSRDMQEDLSVEELCRRAIEHLIPAMQFPEVTVPVIELKGKRFTSENYAEGLSHGLHAQIRVEGEVLGHLRVYYAQERPFLIPEEQNLVNGIADAFSTWLERRQAEEALREAHERAAWLARFPEENPNPVVRVSAEGTVLYCNPAAVEVPGWTCDVGGLLREPFLSLVARAMTEGHEVRQDVELGGAFYLVWAEPFPSEHYANLYGRDITERKRAEESLQETNEQLRVQTEELQTQAEELRAQAEELTDTNTALRESEEQFRRAIEDAPIPIIMHAEDGQVLRISHTWAALTGYTLADIPTVDAWLSRAVYGEGANAVRDYMRGRFQGDRRTVNVEFAVRTREGRTQHWSFNASSPGTLRDGRRFVVGMAVDITERRRAEEALRELNVTLESKVAERTAQLQQRARQLQKLALELSQAEDRERKRMAEILHDDLQQIIAGAKFHLNVLRNRVKADASVQALGSQIDQMLKEAVEKSRGLSHELSPAVLHHGDLTETLRWLAHQVQAKHGLVVHVRANDPVHLPSEAIGGFLYKAAQELLFNVVKHARVKEARLRVRRYGQCVCVSVSDRGCGFDPQRLRETAGFGLLSIRERIELLGGRMKIKSVKGKGSTFFLVVPDREQVVAPPPAGVTAPPPGAAGPQAQNRLRVLLADDHRIVRESLRLLLSDEPDVEIVGEAAHGREAVDLALRLEPDVVIMDVSMPLIDGDEATCQIKEHLPQIRVIALSTYNEPETMEKMYRAGAESYVLKTASSEELLAAIRGKEPSSQDNPV